MLQWDAVEMMETSMTIVMSACLHTIILEIVAVMLMNSPLMVNGIRTMIRLGLSLIYLLYFFFYFIRASGGDYQRGAGAQRVEGG